MAIKLTDLDRSMMQVEALSRQLRDAEKRNLEYRQEVADLQTRISGLIAQLHQPQSLDEVIHPRT